MDWLQLGDNMVFISSWIHGPSSQCGAQSGKPTKPAVQQEDAYKAALECNSEPLQGQVLRVEPCYSAGARASSHKPLPSSPDKASGRQKAPAPKVA